MWRFLTAGESHGPALTVIIDGIPAGLPLTVDDINRDLARRQQGHGRGGRMKIEQDCATVLGGILGGRTIGAPLALQIENRDWPNWKGKELPPLTVPRPGHADLAGMSKYGLDDARPILERASARETAGRVAAGAVARAFLAQFGVRVDSYVVEIGGIATHLPALEHAPPWDAVEASPVRCPNADAAQAMMQRIDEARRQGDSLGGVFVIVATGVPAGLGSHAQWDRRLDAQLAQAVMSIQAIKGIEIGPAFENARLPGTQVHDPIDIVAGRIVRPTNRAGGIEGGMSNGEPIIVHAAMKPIPTTVSPQRSVDLATGAPAQTQYQRSDVCAVPAASVVGEAMVAWVLANALHEKLGGDSLAEILAHWESWNYDPIA